MNLFDAPFKPHDAHDAQVKVRPNRAHRRAIDKALKAQKRRGQRAYMRVLKAQEIAARTPAVTSAEAFAAYDEPFRARVEETVERQSGAWEQVVRLAEAEPAFPEDLRS